MLSYSGYQSTLNYLKNDPDLKKRVNEASARIQSVIDSKIKTIKGLYSEGNFIVEESLLNLDANLNPLIDEYLLTQKDIKLLQLIRHLLIFLLQLIKEQQKGRLILQRLQKK